MTYSGIVQKYKEGIGAFDWPEGVGRGAVGGKTSQICVTCTILFETMVPCFIMSDTYDFIASIYLVHFNHFRGVM